MLKVIEGTPWMLVCTDSFDVTVSYFRDVMSLSLTGEGVPSVDTQFKRYAQFVLPGGPVIEVLEPFEQFRHLYKGIIYSITVEDVLAARAEMEAKGTLFVSPVFDDQNGFGWTYYRLPSGDVFQIQGAVRRTEETV